MGDSAALDVLVRDLRQSPASQAQWERMSNDEIVWRTQRSVVGWRVESAHLFRYEGKYKDGQWSDYTKSLIHEQIKYVSFTFLPRSNKNTHIQEHAAVKLTLNAMQCTVTLRNRRLLYD